MTCERWEDVAFSSEYLATGHSTCYKASPLASKDDVAAASVRHQGFDTRSASSTAGAAFRQRGRKPATIVPVDARTDCLLQVQEGTVGAYLGHDTFLTGMLEQNRALRVVDEGTLQHYGIAIAPGHTSRPCSTSAVLAGCAPRASRFRRVRLYIRSSTRRGPPVRRRRRPRPSPSLPLSAPPHVRHPRVVHSTSRSNRYRAILRRRRRLRDIDHHPRPEVRRHGKRSPGSRAHAPDVGDTGAALIVGVDQGTPEMGFRDHPHW